MTAAVFDALLSAADDVVDGIYAETFSFLPMIHRKGDGAVSEDPDRDPIPELIAVMDDQGRELLVGTERSSSGPEIIALEKYLPQGIKVGDQFIREKTGKTYQVTAQKPDGLGRVILSVVEA